MISTYNTTVRDGEHNSEVPLTKDITYSPLKGSNGVSIVIDWLIDWLSEWVVKFNNLFQTADS